VEIAVLAFIEFFVFPLSCVSNKTCRGVTVYSALCMRMNVILKIEGSVCVVWEEWHNRLTGIGQHHTNGKLTRSLDLEQHLLISLLLRAVRVLLHLMDPSHHGILV